MDKVTAFTVRVPSDLYAALKEKAKAERRSVHSQMLACFETCIAEPQRNPYKAMQTAESPPDKPPS